MTCDYDYPWLSPVPWNHPAAAVVLGLFAESSDFCDPAGSAVLVAPGLAVTSRHLIVQYAEVFETTKLNGATPRMTHSIRAVQLVEDGARISYRVLRAAAPPIASDVILLHVERLLPEGGRHAPNASDQWPTVPLNVLPPREGESIISYGFRGRKLTRVESILEYGPLLCSIGKIVEIFPEALASRVDLPYGFPWGAAPSERLKQTLNGVGPSASVCVHC